MMRIAMVAAVLMAGCGISVSTREVGGGRISIEADGRRSSPTDRLAAIHERAGKLCPNGYDVVDKVTGVRSSSIIVECR